MEQVSLNIQDDDLCDALWETKYNPVINLCTFTPKKAACWVYILLLFSWQLLWIDLSRL